MMLYYFIITKTNLLLNDIMSDLNLRLKMIKDGLPLFFVTSFEFESEMAICGVGRNMGLGLESESGSSLLPPLAPGLRIPASALCQPTICNLKI